ncbi:hypothetical protein AAK967_00065 [Atopobiaceae bacterium 24-176]
MSDATWSKIFTAALAAVGTLITCRDLMAGEFNAMDYLTVLVMGLTAGFSVGRWLFGPRVWTVNVNHFRERRPRDE